MRTMSALLRYCALSVIAVAILPGLPGCDDRGSGDDEAAPPATTPASASPHPTPATRPAMNPATSPLVVTVADKPDPAPVGEAVTYTITVRNDGKATARNVAVIAALPEALKFQKAAGATEAQFTGSAMAFRPLPELLPGTDATWIITAMPQGAGEARLQVSVNSDGLGERIESVERTKLVAAGGAP